MAHPNIPMKQPAENTEGTRPGRVYQPNADIVETSEAVRLTLDMPGADERSIEVELSDGVLRIEGRVSLDDYADLRPVYGEYNVGNFERRFRISDAIDAGAIEARLADGVLELTLPKADRVRARTIEVRAS